MVSKYKAEAIEREYIQRLMDETFEGMMKKNIDKTHIPECIKVAILRHCAIEVVACRICQLARWN